MDKIGDSNVYVGRTDEGKFLAATNSAPYFCFEADTEEELIALVTRALLFYIRNLRTVTDAVSKSQTYTHLVPYKVLRSRDLVHA